MLNLARWVGEASMVSVAALSGRWPDYDRPSCGPVAVSGPRALGSMRELDQFLAEIERRAFRIAQVSLRNADDALDAVQDAMLKLVRSYSHKPSAEWRPLFFRILQNCIRDAQRRRSVVQKLRVFLPARHDEPEDSSSALEQVADDAPAVSDVLEDRQAMEKLEQSLAKLPARQREAFILRNFESMDVAQTALAMGCSQGSVKTHYSRAVHALRTHMHEFALT